MMEDPSVLRTKLEEYEKNLQKVNDLLSNDATDENLIKIRQDLIKVIDLTKTLIKKTDAAEGGSAENGGKQGSATARDPASIAVDFEAKQKKKRAYKKALTIGSRCEILHDGNWYAAVIENVVVDPATKQNKYTIRWILNNKEETVIGDDSIREIKATRGELDVTQLKLGSKCKAKYSADGNWYNASILEINKSGCLVHYTEYGNRERVPFEYITDLGVESEPSDSLTTAAPSKSSSVPEHLRVLPTDSESIRANKKRKLKSLKRKANLAVQDHVSEQRQHSWQAFKAKKQGKRSMKKKSIFAVEESEGSLAGRVGVIGSAAKMSEVVKKPKRLAW